MQDIFSLEELTVLRQSLNVISIQGKDAKPIAMLQDKLEQLIVQMSIDKQEKSPAKK
jgi:hypothetical protein